MKKVVIGIIIGVSASLTVWAAEAMYSLAPITDDASAIACGKSKGKAALVAELTPDGQLATGWEAFCLQEVKK